MRKVLLLTVLIFGYYLPAFSQHYLLQNYRLQRDAPFSNLSLKNNLKTPDLLNCTDFKWSFNKSRNNKKLIYPNLTDINSKSEQDPIAIIKAQPTFDNMPCVKPQGYFPMPIVEPDTTVRYTLLIKKY